MVKQMAQVTVHGATYYYEVIGQGDPLLLLHGFSGNSQSWADHVPVLAQQFCVITLDLLGHGKTDSPTDPTRYSMENVAADVTAVLRQLPTVNGQSSMVNLLGYSMGGRLALYLAVHYTQLFSALILESASPGLETETERSARRASDHALAGRIERDGMASFVREWEALPLWASQQQLASEKRAALRAQRLGNNPTGLANSLRGMGTGAQPSLWPHLPQLTLPVLLLAGELDEKFVGINRKMHRLLLNSHYEIVAGAGHAMHLERPLLFQKAVFTFLAGLKTGK